MKKIFNFLYDHTLGSSTFHYVASISAAVNVGVALYLMGYDRNQGLKWGLLNTLFMGWFIFRGNQLARLNVKKGK